MSRDKPVISAYEPEDLPAAIAEARRRTTQPVSRHSSPMIELVAKAIDELMSRQR